MTDKDKECRSQREAFEGANMSNIDFYGGYYNESLDTYDSPMVQRDYALFKAGAAWQQSRLLDAELVGRDAFEAWALQQKTRVNGKWDLTKTEKGTYKLALPMYAYQGWQACAAHYQPLLEQVREALELADAALRGANMNMNIVERKVAESLAILDRLIAANVLPSQVNGGQQVHNRFKIGTELNLSEENTRT